MKAQCCEDMTEKDFFQGILMQWLGALGESPESLHPVLISLLDYLTTASCGQNMVLITT